MARFALYSNGKKLETIEGLRKNFNLKDMENNFRTKSLHRWLAEKGLRDELKKIEDIPPAAEDLADLLMECFTLSDEQKNTVKQRAEDEAKWGQEEQDVSEQLDADNSSPDAQSVPQVIDIHMPNFGSSDKTALLSKWQVQDGDKVKKGDILCNVETDKATFEVESQFDGRVTELLVCEGENIPVSTAILKLIVLRKNENDSRLQDIDLGELKFKKQKVYLPRGCYHLLAFETFMLAGKEEGDRYCNKNNGVYISRDGGYSWIKHQRLSENLGDYPLSKCKSRKLNSKWYLFAQGKGIFEFDETGNATLLSETVCGDQIDFNECYWDITFDGREFVAAIGRHLKWDDMLGEKNLSYKTTIYRFMDFCDPDSCRKVEIDLGCWITELNFFKEKFFGYGSGFFESSDGISFTRFIEPSAGRSGMFCCDDALFITFFKEKTRYTLNGDAWHELPYSFNEVAKRNGVYYGWDYSNLYISQNLVTWHKIQGVYVSTDALITDCTFCSPSGSGSMEICRLPF